MQLKSQWEGRRRARDDRFLFRLKRGICELQTTLAIPNEGGASFRSDNNNALQTLASLNSGAAAPAVMYAYMPWADTTTGLLKQRNAANTGWVVRGTLAESFVIDRASNTILAAGDFARTFRGTAGFTQTLTAAATLGDGWFCYYRIETGITVVFDPNASENIDGATTKSITGPSSGIIFCTGAVFYTIGFPNTAVGISPAQGRLTLTSATPVTTADVTGAATILYALYNGNQLPIYNGSAFVMTTFTELSNITTNSATGNAGPAAVANNSNYDLFVWSNSGVPTLTRGPLWTSDTARGAGAGTTELQQLNGIWTNKVAITNGPGANLGTYVGTVRSDGSAQINDSAAKRHVWNAFNRVDRAVSRVDATASWTYTTATFRQANASTSNQLDVLAGLAEDAIDISLQGQGLASAGGVRCTVGIGINSTTVDSSTRNLAQAIGASTADGCQLAWYHGVPPLGRTTYAWLEQSSASGTTTWTGTQNGSKSGLSGVWRA